MQRWHPSRTPQLTAGDACRFPIEGSRTGAVLDRFCSLPMCFHHKNEGNVARVRGRRNPVTARAVSDHDDNKQHTHTTHARKRGNFLVVGGLRDDFLVRIAANPRFEDPISSNNAPIEGRACTTYIGGVAAADGRVRAARAVAERCCWPQNKSPKNNGHLRARPFSRVEAEFSRPRRANNSSSI